MVSISQELTVESEARLRRVLRVTDIEHLAGAWRWVRDSPSDGALATVRDIEGWSALVPAARDAPEPFGVTLSTFPTGVDNSGYIGWLSSAVKERTGSGVFVVCGDNPRRGGIFDYLGYPLAAADAVRSVIDDLRSPPAGPADSLDLRVFRVVEVSPASAISPATVLEFRERPAERLVEASYRGGDIARGFLLGHREGERITTAYTQSDTSGRLRTGTAVLHLSREADGGTLLTEYYTWADGTRGRNVLRAAAPGGAGDAG